MEIKLPELVDRLSILFLKWIHGGAVKGELAEYYREFVCKTYGIELPVECFFDLLRVNAQIWELESEIRAGREGALAIEEVGRRALAIRDFNRDRIVIKNRIADTYCGYKEVKIDHASQG